MTTLSPIVQALIDRRKAMGLTQVDVGERMRRNAQVVNCWERGHTDPSLRSLENWCHALGTKLRTSASAAEKIERNKQILAAVKSGRRVGEVAIAFGVSRRTVTYLKSGKGWRPSRVNTLAS